MKEQHTPRYVAVVSNDQRYASIPGKEQVWIIARSREQLTAWGAVMAFLGIWPGYREGPANHLLLKEKKGAPPVWWQIASE